MQPFWNLLILKLADSVQINLDSVEYDENKSS